MALIIAIMGVVFGVCAAKDPQIITSMPDGIRVIEGKDMVLEEGLWTLLLTITEPGEKYRNQQRQEFLAAVTTVLDHVMNEPVTPIFRREQQTLLKRKLILIRQVHSIKFVISEARPRRGLINVGGWALNKVFGVATEKEVNIVKK